MTKERAWNISHLVTIANKLMDPSIITPCIYFITIKRLVFEEKTCFY